MDKSIQEKKLLQDKIQNLKNEINTEIKERQELEARLQLISTANGCNGRAQELEQVYQRLYAPKLAQFDGMMAKMIVLKGKLEAAK